MLTTKYQLKNKKKKNMNELSQNEKKIIHTIYIYILRASP